MQVCSSTLFEAKVTCGVLANEIGHSLLKQWKGGLEIDAIGREDDVWVLRQSMRYGTAPVVDRCLHSVLEVVELYVALHQCQHWCLVSDVDGLSGRTSQSHCETCASRLVGVQ